jgi:hypothetical protein
MFPLIWAFLQNISLKVWKWIGIVAGLIATFFYIFTSGKRAARREIAEDNAKLIDQQFEESTKAPKSRDELVKRLEDESKEGGL